MTTPRHVVIVQETLPRYRVRLFEEIVSRAAQAGVRVELVHGRAPGDRGRRLGAGTVTGAIEITNRYLPLPRTPRSIVWQPALRRCLCAELVVVEQANRLLLNPLLLAAQLFGGPSVAFWGHGRNLQSSSSSRAERVKRAMLRAPRWWFAYTSGVADYLDEAGFPRSRVTTVQNAIDVASLRDLVEEQRLFGVTTAPWRCAFVGGLYGHKRLPFLFRAADAIRARVPGFELVIAGDGEQRHLVEAFVRTRPWAEYVGSVDGPRHAEVLARSRLLLMPGLVGLVVLDSFAAGVPVVTTADALHSPEIEYATSGENAVVLPAGTGPEEYAEAVSRLLVDEHAWHDLRDGALAAGSRYTVEEAADHFVEGLRQALSSGDAERSAVVLYDPDPLNPFGRELARLIGRSRPVRLYCTPQRWVPDAVTVVAELGSSIAADGLARSAWRRAAGPVRAIGRATVSRQPLVVVWTRHSWEAVVFVAATRLLRHPTVAIAHNPAALSRKRGIARWAEDALRRASSEVVVLDDDLVAAAAEGRHGVVVAPHPAYSGWRARFFDPMPERVGCGGHRVLFLGSLRHDKGIQDLARIAQATDVSDVTFVVAGRGALPDGTEDALRASGHRLERPGGGDPLDDEALAVVLGTVDVLVAPYAGATQSGSLVLALTCGVPALGYGVRGLRSLLNDRSVTADPDPAALGGLLGRYLRAPWPTWAVTPEHLDSMAASAWGDVLDSLGGTEP